MVFYFENPHLCHTIVICFYFNKVRFIYIAPATKQVAKCLEQNNSIIDQSFNNKH